MHSYKVLIFLNIWMTINSLASAVYITFYTETNFRGRSTEMHVVGQAVCYDIPESFQHAVSSIDLPDGDLYMYDRPDCEGNLLRIYQYSSCTGKDLSCNSGKVGTTCGQYCNHPSAVSWDKQPSSFIYFNV